jgi:flagellin-like protein
MNVFGRASHRWRKNRKRGVSPIIATILLVAITVVLAAVLYVLISGLTKTGASTPYELGMALQTPGGVIGPINTPGTYYITMDISPTSGLTTAIMGLSVLSSSSVAQTNYAASGGCTNGITTYTTNCLGTAGAGWYAVLVNSVTGAVAGTFSGGAWTNLGTATTVALNSNYVIVIVSTVAFDGNGYTLTAYGTGTSSVSGSQYL